ncbi:MAG: FAD-dependent monooxygenase, partial [Chlamydiia bacterium]|nr:FAD-dependent monooxygenase [Chlamydiia bacterium]
DGGKELFAADFGAISGGYNYAVSMQQGPLLKKLIQLAGEFPTFAFVGNAAVSALLQSPEGVSGVEITHGDEKFEVSCRLVVGADGRFSKVRELANIRMETAKSEFDVVWFEVPPAPGKEYSLEIEMSGEGLAVIIPEEEGRLRIGYTLPKGSYSRLLDEGIESFIQRLSKALPKIEGHLRKHLTSFKQCSLLDVKVALAKRFCQNGLLLIGDAAHTASPVGAQGNKLAICDAVLYHPAIVDALGGSDKVVSETALAPTVEKRLVEVKRTFRMQQRMSKLILSRPGSFLSKVRRTLIPRIAPYLAPRMLRQIAFCSTPIHVATNKFQYQTEYGRLHRYYLLKVSKIVRETAETTSFHLEVPPELTLEFSYLPGQFITLRVLEEGQLFKRCYSLSSCPEEDDTLRITVKRITKGTISNDLIDHVKVGDELLVLPPAGQMTPKAAFRRYVLIAGGSGIAPLISILRAMLAEPYVENVTLIYASHDAESIIFKDELKKLQKKHADRFTLIHNITTEHKRLTKEKLKSLFPKLSEETGIYLCGPQKLMELAALTARELGVAPAQLHREIYTSLKEPFEVEQIVLHPLEVGSGVEEPSGPHEVTMILDGKAVTISCPEEETILEAALDAHLSPPYSCREGICTSCMATLKEGKVDMAKHHSLTQEEAAEGLILTCQAKPLTKKCVIVYE